MHIYICIYICLLIYDYIHTRIYIYTHTRWCLSIYAYIRKCIRSPMHPAASSRLCSKDSACADVFERSARSSA